MPRYADLVQLPLEAFRVYEVTEAGGYVDVEIIAVIHSKEVLRFLLTYHPSLHKWLGMLSMDPLCNDPFSTAEMLTRDSVDKLLSVYHDLSGCPEAGHA